MSIFKLPNELVLRVLKYLNNEEVDKLIKSYKTIPSASPIMLLLYERLFGGTLLIVNGEPRVPFKHDYELTVDSFEDKMMDSEEYENKLFQKIRPNIIEFRFTRHHSDYRRYISDLSSLLHLIDSPNQRIQEYFERSFRINIHIDSHLVFMENPDSLKSIIIRLLLGLSKHSLAGKIRNLTVKASEIGSVYVAQWSQLFKYFTALEFLDLSGNLLRSNYEEYLDVWGMSKKFPDTLTMLSFKNNMLTYISKDFFMNLPKSLKYLDMNENDIEIIEPCDLGDYVPKLQILSLNYTKLCVLSPKSPPLLQQVRFNTFTSSTKRTGTTKAKTYRSSEDDSTKKSKTYRSSEDDSTSTNTKKASLFKDVIKLLRLAKPETKLLIFAIVCLAVTSATSMSLPLIIGRIIDTANPLKVSGDDDGAKEEVEKVEEDEERTKRLFFGLSQTQFFSALGVLFTVGSFANFGRIYLLRTVGERLVARLRSRLFSKILAQDAYFFDVGPSKTGMKTGDLISRIANDTQVISKSLSMNISDGMRSIISGVVGLSMMCFVSWKLTLCMSLMFPPLILMSFFYGRKIKALSKLIQENIGALTKATEERLNGVKVIQSFAQQRGMVHGYNKEIKEIFNSSMREGKLSGIYYSTNGFIGNVTMIGLLFIGTKLIGMGEMSIGDLSSFMMYAIYTGSSVFGLGNFYTELMKGIGAAERIFDLVDYRPKIPNNLGRKYKLHGDITFKDVNFSYPSRPDVIFDNLNLHIREGENICIVGPSGSGKSTIGEILLRFYDVNSGSVSIGTSGNNVQIKDLNLNNYRDQLGYVQQEPLLFSGTIKENVVFGKEDATDTEIEEALALSHSTAFIRNLPDGLETKIGASNKTLLSGGQKQRLSLARTLIKKPRILILDEATSALDSISEEEVMKNLLGLNREYGITIISIAHRLSTIKNSDRIIVLDQNGNITEDGPFSELNNDPNSKFNKLLIKNELE
ncbi:MDL1 [Candida oxycetoniae]|uniref:MDL1 n=1 Tax=Candida oxycetoniae TaxID=497107 RepID=A0AAI9SVN8_9ASCO|nr:MDL1 [Candida oxycetoniae]KAI3403812.2 MDL1 [Candida oxycetoniae]